MRYKSRRLLSLPMTFAIIGFEVMKPAQFSSRDELAYLSM
jgi:hypothetical protein